MKHKITFAFLMITLLGCSTLHGNALGSSPKKLVELCLKAIKNKDYVKSYDYFSISLKNQVKLEDHVANLQYIENHCGRLVDFSDKLPMFRNYILDEDMFKGWFSKGKQKNFNYFLHYEEGDWIVNTEVIKEGDEYKISAFYLEQLKE